MFANYAVAGALVIVARSLMTHDTRAKIQDAWIAIGLMAGAAYSLPMATLLTAGQPTTFDAVFYYVDRALGLSGQGLCWYANTHATLWAVLTVVYEGVPLFIALVYLIERDVEMLMTLALGLVLAPVFYLLMPAVGPVHAFSGWPWQAPRVGFEMLRVSGSRLPCNCFPSGHLMLAFVPIIYARSWKLRAPELAYLTLMVMATVGSGEHYAVDLLAAIPYSLAMRAVVRSKLREEVSSCMRTWFSLLWPSTRRLASSRSAQPSHSSWE